jgi:ketosteroid isomerase-like protein
MKSLTLLVMFACVSGGVVLAGAPQPSNDQTAINAVKQLEQEMGEAMIRVDINRLNEIYADDFAGVSKSGKVFTKKEILDDFESGHDKLESFEIGPIDVQVFGNVAVAHASVTEKRVSDGKDTSGEFVWMDILEKRGGKWLVVRSAGKRLK